MATDALKSASITNLDTIVSAGAAPPAANVNGCGAQAAVGQIEDYVTPTASGIASTSSKYKMVRVPTFVLVKDVRLVADADLDTGGGSASLAVDVGAYYSDSTVDGTPAASQGVLISASCFGAALPFGGGTASYPNAITVTNGPTAGPVGWPSANRQEPLWQALGLASDPGGMIDIVVAVHTAANTGASQPMRLLAEVVYP